MEMQELKLKAKGRLGYCESCEICDGKACVGMIPGPGDVSAEIDGIDSVAIRNYKAWKKIRLVQDPIAEDLHIDTSFEFFGKKFAFPIFAGSISNIELHYSKFLTESEYDDILFSKCKENGIVAFSGDGENESIFDDAINSIKKVDGMGIPTIKPWVDNGIQKRLEKVKSSNAFAVAMDMDAIGTPFLRNEKSAVRSYTVEELKNVINSVNIPFIIKGVMNVKTAKKAIEAGAKAIVVSNHGGRVLNDMPATADVLKEISDFAKDKCIVLVDGGIRTGRDVFKALALGASGVLIARPVVRAIFGDIENGVKTYLDFILKDLKYSMYMCGARKLSDISYDMIEYVK